MPDYDLGKAHGKIVIDTDTKGVGKSDAALANFEKTVASLQAVITKFDGVLDRLESQLDDVASAARKADSALDDLDGGYASVHKSAGRAHGSSREYNASLEDQIDSVKRLYRVLNPLYNAYNHVSTSLSNFNDANNIRSYARATNSAFLLSNGLKLLGGRIIGLNKGYDTLTDRQSRFFRVAGKITAASLGLAAFSKIGGGIANLGLFEKGLFKLYTTAAQGSGKLQKLAQVTNSVLVNNGRAYRGVKALTDGFDGMGRSVITSVLGFKVAKNAAGKLASTFNTLTGGSGKLGLVIKGAIASVGGLGAALGALGEIGAAGLRSLSNGIANIVNVVKTLGGGLLAIPGVIGTVLAATIPLKLAFKQLGKTFGDVFKAETPEDLGKAIDALPEKFRPLGRALGEVKKTFDDLKNASQDSFLGDLGKAERQVQSLSDNLKGPLIKDFKLVNNAARRMKDNLVAAVTDPGNVTNLNTIFQSAVKVIGNVSKALQPAISGLSTLAAVGSKFFADFSGGAEGAANKFNDFIQKANETGKLRKYMDDALKGVKDLIKGTVDLGRGLGKILTAFQTKSGDNALDRYAKAMQRFNKAIDESKATGFLNKFSNGVKSANFDKLKQVGDYLRDLLEPLRQLYAAAAPFFSAVGEGFQGTFIPLVKVATQILETFADALSGLGGYVGSILGIAAGFKVIALAFAPIKNVGLLLAGLGVGIKGVLSLFSGLAALSGFSGLASGLSRVAGSLKKIALIGGIAAAAVALVVTAATNGQQGFKEMDKAVQESSLHLREFKTALKEAFIANDGKAGKNVTDTVRDGLDGMISDLDNVASKMPGFTDTIEDFYNGLTGTGNKDFNDDSFGPNESKQLNALQDQANQAKDTSAEFKRLKEQGVDLGAIVTGDAHSFEQFTDSLAESGGASQLAAEKLIQYRKTFVDTQNDIASAGSGSIKLTEGIQTIAEAGGDATTKLQGLKEALAGLGLDQSSDIDAAFAYAKAIKAIGDEAANAVDVSQPLENVFGPDGALNYDSANAENLKNVLEDAVTGFQNMAIKTGDVQGEFAKLQEQVPKLAAAFTPVGGNVDDTAANIQGLITQLGGVPDIVSILLQLKGGDELQQDLTSILAKLTGTSDAVIKVPLIGDKDTLQRSLDSILGPGKAAVGDNTITIDRANVSPEALAGISKALGVQLPGQPAPPPVKMPVQPTPPKAALPGANPGEAKPQAAAATPPPPAPAPPPAKVDTTQIDAANAKIKELSDKLAALQATVIKPTIDPSLINQVTEIETKIASLQEKVNAFQANDIKFKIIAEGVNETVFVFSSQIPQAIETTKTAAQSIATVFVAAFGQVASAGTGAANQIKGAFDGLVSGAAGQGSAFVDAFASGLSSNGAAVAAAQQMAANIKAQFHQSPPKKGPLSEHGDAAKYAGGAFVDAYATGFNGNNSAVSAAQRMAGGVGSAVSQGPFDLGKLLGAANDFLSIGSKIADLFGNIADQIFQGLKFASDPLGKGTFFGQTPGKAFGYVKDTSKSDDERAQERVSNGKEKALNPEEQKQADQTEADAKKQAELTSTLLDEVVAGKRIAPQTEEEKAADKKTATDKKKDAKDAAKAAGDTPKTPAIKAKNDKDFQDAANQAGADLSAKLDALSPEDLAAVQNGTLSVKTDEQILQELVKQTPLLQGAIDVSKDANSSQEKATGALGTIDDAIAAQGEAKTPAQKQQMAALESLSSTIQSNAGLTTGENPIDKAASVAGSVSNTAKDIFASIQSVMDSVGAAKNLGDILVRGVENSEDVMKIIDNVQQFITTAAQIAQTVASGLSTAAGIAGASGGTDGGAISGGLGAASTIASLISGALSTVNAVIDLAQEAYTVAGKYVGEFLGFLTGGAGGQLMGDVRFLLDENDGTLKTWSKDNPDDKRSFDNPFQKGGLNDTKEPQIGSINVYGGPGQDPRDMTNEMMFAVAAAGSGAGGYN